MSPTVTFLVLLAAVLHAVWNAMLKSTGDRLVIMAWIAASSSIMAIPFAIAEGVPAWPVWHYLLAAICIHTAYMLLLVGAYTHGDFGRVYPLARGMAPAIVTLAGFLWVGERLSPLEVVGICLVAGGIVSLAGRRRDGAVSDPRGIAYALATGLSIATYSVVDGLGGRAAATPLQYVAWLFLTYGVPLCLVALAMRGRRAVFAGRRIAVTGIGGGAMSMLAYGIVIWAMRGAPLGPVSALRETSVVFGAVISAVILKEGLGPIAVVASIVVAMGVILIRIAGG